LATLSDHHLNIAFEVIRNFKNIQQKNLENIKIKPLIYLNQAEVAEMLQQNDINMDRRKVNVYYKRGHLPSDRKSTRLNSSHVSISYAVLCLKRKNKAYVEDRGAD